VTPLLLITNRDGAIDFGNGRGPLRYFTTEKSAIRDFDDWTELTLADFRKKLVEVAVSFPDVPPERSEEQKHVTFFIHGFNCTFGEALAHYMQLRATLYGDGGLGQLVLFSWPANSSVASYLPDRADARASGEDLAEVFTDLYDHLRMVERAVELGARECRAKISVIAHSMGNYVLQKALAVASKRVHAPQGATLVHQVAMVAADVDADLFQKDKPVDSDGSLMADLCYRIVALYTGRDQALGASAGLKHGWTRRLGRSGLADAKNVWDNVADVDVTDLLENARGDAHSAVFKHPASMELLRRVLIGVDRKLLLAETADPLRSPPPS
jgi:esterase/lipase superfamily enzyme